MGATTENGQLAAKVLDEYMRDFQRRNPTLRVFSAYLHMDEATPHLHIDFVPYTTGSKRGLDTRVSLKQALSALGVKGGTRSETELNQWVQHEKKLAEIAPMVKDVERFAVKYSYDLEEVLPEAGTLESGKTYREKKAKPLIGKIITVLRAVYREYLSVSNRFEKLQDAYNREQDRNERLKNRLEEFLGENRELRTLATDFGRVRTVMGAEQVNAVIDRAKQQEQIEAEQKRAVRRKHSKEAR